MLHCQTCTYNWSRLLLLSQPLMCALVEFFLFGASNIPISMLRNKRQSSIKYKTAIFIILRYLPQKWLRTNESFTNNVHLIAGYNLLFIFFVRIVRWGKSLKACLYTNIILNDWRKRGTPWVSYPEFCKTQNAPLCELEKGSLYRLTPLCCNNILIQVALLIEWLYLTEVELVKCNMQAAFPLRDQKILSMLHNDFSLGMDNRWKA